MGLTYLRVSLNEGGKYATFYLHLQYQERLTYLLRIWLRGKEWVWCK